MGEANIERPVDMPIIEVNSRTLLAEIILHWLFKISRNSQVNSNKYVAISSGLFPIIKNSRPEF